MTLGLRRDPDLTLGLFHRWRVAAGTATGLAAVAAEGATEIRVNGRRVAQTDREHTPLITAWTFPGRYTVDLPDNPLLAAAPQRIDVAGGGDPYRPGAGLATRVKPAATAAVEQQVRAYLDGCAQSTGPEPRGCPFTSYHYGDVGSPKWTITTYPRIAVALREGAVVVWTTAYGGATFSGTEEGFFSGREPFSDDQSFEVTGRAATSGGQVRFEPDTGW